MRAESCCKADSGQPSSLVPIPLVNDELDTLAARHHVAIRPFMMHFAPTAHLRRLLARSSPQACNGRAMVSIAEAALVRAQWMLSAP